jgi:hypothetical protein
MAMKRAICLLVMAMSVPVLLLHASWQQSIGIDSGWEVVIALVFGIVSVICGAVIFVKSTAQNIIAWWTRPSWRR